MSDRRWLQLELVSVGRTSRRHRRMTARQQIVLGLISQRPRTAQEVATAAQLSTPDAARSLLALCRHKRAEAVRINGVLHFRRKAHSGPV